MKKSIALLVGLSLSFSAHAYKPCYSRTANQDYTCVNLSGEDMSYTDQSYADWMGADLHDVNLEGANLEMAFLSQANLTKANLKNAHAYAIKLYKADLNKADIRGADMRGCNLIGADMRTVIVNKKTLFNGCSIDSNTKLPFAWGDHPLVEAVDRGMITIREFEELEE